jgi:hypothetical protein
MRFSIRDLMWATVVVAMGLAWWLDRNALYTKLLASVSQAHRLYQTCVDAEVTIDMLTTDRTGKARFPVIDWKSILNEPLVEP